MTELLADAKEWLAETDNPQLPRPEGWSLVADLIARIETDAEAAAHWERVLCVVTEQTAAYITENARLRAELLVAQAERDAAKAKVEQAEAKQPN